MLGLSTKEIERAAHYWDGSWGTLIAAAAQGSNMGAIHEPVMPQDKI